MRLTLLKMEGIFLFTNSPFLFWAGLKIAAPNTHGSELLAHGLILDLGDVFRFAVFVIHNRHCFRRILRRTRTEQGCNKDV